MRRDHDEQSDALGLRTRAVQQVLFRDENLLFAYLCGSRGEKIPLPCSFPPLAVYVKTESRLAEQKLDLFNQLADVLPMGAIELIVLNTAPVSVASRVIQRREVILDRDPGKRCSYEAVTLREFYNSLVQSESPVKENYTVRDRELLVRKIAELRVYRDRLAEFSGMTTEEYGADQRWQRTVGRTFSLLVETCADIAVQIVKDRALGAPKECVDAFRVLSKSHVIDSYLSTLLERMAAFRTVLLQQSGGGDPEMMVLILKRHLCDFDRFRDAILVYLEKMTHYLHRPLVLTLEMEPLKKFHSSAEDF